MCSLSRRTAANSKTGSAAAAKQASAPTARLQAEAGRAIQSRRPCRQRSRVAKDLHRYDATEIGFPACGKGSLHDPSKLRFRLMCMKTWQATSDDGGRESRCQRDMGLAEHRREAFQPRPLLGEIDPLASASSPVGSPVATYSRRNPQCRTAYPTTAAPRRSCSYAAPPPATRDARDGTAARSAAVRPASRTTPARWRATGFRESAAPAPAAGTATAARRSPARSRRTTATLITSSRTWLRSSDQNVIWRCAWCSECSAHHQRN